MATKIIHKKSSVTNRVPVSADLEVGELALNLADQKLYSKQSDGTVVEMAGGGDQLALTENCKNVSGGALTIGTPVYQSGTAGNAMEVQAARADTAGSMPAIGVITSTLADDAEGTLVLTGFVQGLNTSAFSEGDTLYIGATGGLVNTAPAGESNLIQNVGKVIKVHTSNGSIMVTGAGRANATPNLDDGDIFIGNASNQAVTTSLATEVATLGYLPKSGGTMTGNIAHDTNFTLDVGGEITLDANAAGTIRLKDNNVQYATIWSSGGDFKILSTKADDSIKFQGYDDTSYITALELDMSDAGTAIFNNDIKLPDDGKAIFGASSDLQIYHDSSVPKSVISEQGGGPLELLTSQLNVATADGSSDILRANATSVKLYGNNAVVLNATSTGISVTGTVEAASVDLGDWVVTETGGDLYFSVSGVNKMKLDASGNLDVVGNVNSNATIT
jgi:hypothetical protein